MVVAELIMGKITLLKSYRKLAVTALILSSSVWAMAQTSFVPLSLTGFNADVIANGIGNSLATTTNDVDGVSYVFVSSGWQFSATSTPFAGGLPASGLITSPLTMGLTYQLANYSANNVLRIASSTAASLTAVSPLAAQNLYVLSMSGSGTCTMTAQVNFTDGTNQQFTSLAVNDWFGATPYEIGQIGRLLRNSFTTVPESSTSGPRLYRHVLAISAANQTKLISNIQFTRTAGAGILNVYAVSAEVPVSCTAPTVPSATSVTATSAVLNWTQAGTPAQWQIKYGASGFNPATSGTSIFTLVKPYTLNPPLANSTVYDYYVRAVCGVGDTSLWSPVTSFTTTCVAPVIASYKDSFICGPGQAILEATATAGGSVKWYTATTGGTALFTGNSFTTPNISTTTTYYAAAVSGTCENSMRQAVVATVRPVPVVNIGNDTTICPGVSYVLNASTPNATYAWNTGASTSSITVNAAGTYSVLVTVNGCGGSDARVITPGVVPVNNLTPAIDLCLGSSVTLNAGNTGSAFVWTPGGATTQTINVSSGGTYSVLIKSATGCTISSSTAVTMRPLPVQSLGNDTSICEGATIVLNAGNPGSAYLWNTGAITQTVSVSDSGTYVVSVTTPFNCKATEDVHVAFLPAPSTEGFNFIPLFYEQLGKVKFSPLHPTGVVSYDWDFGDGTLHSTEVNPTHVYMASGSYTVTLRVYNGCGNSATSLSINVGLTTGIVTLAVPQAEMMIFPNPAKDQVIIESRNGEIKMENIVVTNMFGSIIYQGKANTESQHRLFTSQWAAGVYTIRIVTNKGSVVRRLEVLR
jgi:hypothetical protein